METKNGKLILNLAHLRGGHWPGVKAPPWGIQLPLLENSLGRKLARDVRIEAYVPASSTELIHVVLRHIPDENCPGVNLFAFPATAELERRWNDACRSSG